MRCFLILVLLVFPITNSYAAGFPPLFKASYVVKKGPFELGHAVHELQAGPEGEMVYISSSDTTGLAELLFSDHIRETTRLKASNPVMIPLEYSYRRSGKRNSVISQQFDWEESAVTSHVDETEYMYSLLPGTIDLSAYQVRLMVDLASGQREFSYPVAGKAGIDTYHITHIGDDSIETALGMRDVVVIQRKTKRTTTMWCAKDLYFLPVRIQHEENGNKFNAYLVSVTGLNLP
jgi:hypothetical protein